ncbi:MAG: chemotaxis protein CheW [Ignavibacteria bacterium]|jgi:purine-binding chemotaxis protein CheW
MENQIEKQSEVQEILQLVSFRIDTEEFGVDILKVQEIIRMVPITKVPNAPDFVEGVINLRGRVIPVIDLRIKLGHQKIEYNNGTRIIVVEINSTTLGFVVDSVSEVLRIPQNITEAPPEMVAGIDSDFITAVGKLEDKLLILLDFEKILTADEIKAATL